MFRHFKTCLYFFFLTVTISFGYSQNEHFTQLNRSNGLSVNTIKYITQDYLELIWIGTHDGLCMYNGSKITFYKNTKDNPFTLGDNDISYIFEDSNKDLWVCSTHGGIAKYDRNTDQFINYNKKNGTEINNLHITSVVEIDGKKLIFGTQTGLCFFDLTKEIFYDHPITPLFKRKNISSLYVSKDKSLWIGTLDSGVEQVNLTTTKTTNYSTKGDNLHLLQGDHIKTIVEDMEHNIWVGTWESGLTKISKNGTKTYLHDEHDISSISQNAIFDLKIGVDGKLWIATEDKGLNSYNPTNETFHHIKHTLGDERTIAENSLQCLYIDTNENLWVGTFSNGVSILPKHPSPFNHIKRIAGNQNSLSNNNITSILKDSKNRLWIGTDGGGLNLYNETTKTFKIFKHNEDNPNSIGSNAILEVYEDTEGKIWIGTYRGGLALYNEKKGNFTSYKHNILDEKSISNNIVSYMFEDSKGNFWVSTWRNGFNLFNKKTREFKQYPFGRQHEISIPSIQVNHMVEGKNNDLWLATENGLVNFNIDSQKFIQYKSSFDSKNAISDEAVSSLYLDNSNQLWIGTRGGGLNLFNTKNHLFSNFKGQGFASEIIYHIIPQTETKLWISTNSGISEFNTVTKKIKNFDASEGILGSQFVTGSGFIDKTGVIYFGSTEGLNFFDPKQLTANNQVSRLRFTGFKVFNKEIDYKNNKLNNKHISLAKEINLDYRQSVFTISFSYLNYINPKRTEYEYKLIGFDKEWVQAGNKNFATYTNLDPKKYTFQVRTFNTAESSNPKPIEITIKIIPPFYMTNWFKVSIGLLFIVLLYGLYNFRMRAVNAKRKYLEQSNIKLEKEIKQREKTQELYKHEKEKAEKAVEVKDEFLSNMSHEIRTPLNMILGYLQLISLNKTNIDQFLKVMRVSADNLLHLVNQILELSKIEKGKLQVHQIPFNLQEYIEELTSLFQDSFKNKNLGFNVIIDKNIPDIITGDQPRLNQILTNLLSNALKFTEIGDVNLTIQLIEKPTNSINIKFIVKDTGIGISHSKTELIFEKFTQEDSDITRKFGGTGLGLTIAKELANLLNGKIEVKSKQGEGSTFTVTLPFQKSTLDSLPTTVDTNETKSIKGLNILVVDDNQFNLTLSSTILEANQANSTTAISGKAALELITSNEYDLILMDIHMPEMNGYEVTEQILKTHSKLPILGCTADVFDETYHKCILVGMVDVITKPFQINTLIEKIHLYTLPKKEGITN